jgi:hypothetical protein
MEGFHFDAWTRRRFGLAAGGVTASLFTGAPAFFRSAVAKKRKKKCKPKCGPCRKCKKGKCKAKPAGTVCGAGAYCLPNGSCATTCTTGEECAAGCFCSAPSVEGTRRCIELLESCDAFPQPCTSTAQCPRGRHCQFTLCGPGNIHSDRCVPLCQG